MDEGGIQTDEPSVSCEQGEDEDMIQRGNNEATHERNHQCTISGGAILKGNAISRGDFSTTKQLSWDDDRCHIKYSNKISS